MLHLETEPSRRKVVAARLQQIHREIIVTGDPEKARCQLVDDPSNMFVLELDHPNGDSGRLIEAYRRHTDQGAVLATITQRPKEAWRQRFQPEAEAYQPFDLQVLGVDKRKIENSEGVTDGPSDQR